MEIKRKQGHNKPAIADIQTTDVRGEEQTTLEGFSGIEEKVENHKIPKITTVTTTITQ